MLIKNASLFQFNAQLILMYIMRELIGGFARIMGEQRPIVQAVLPVERLLRAENANFSVSGLFIPHTSRIIIFK